jgi:peptidyl-prolyl cis-trans isomerase SurA
MKKIRNIALLFIFLPLTAWSQDEILLTIGDKPVMRSEFERIYHKNNRVDGYEQKSVKDYLDLFINFKLKVLEAQHMGYDTMRSFVNELAGYREQLARPYLQNRQIIEAQVREAYDHTINEVNASHIMVKLPPNPSPADTLKAFQRIMDIRRRITAGENFEKIAREESDDPSAKQNEGRLGWFSAFMMVFPFENAAYHTPTGSVSMPVRSRYGYHLIRVNATRPALGEIKLAHIMTRAAKNESPEKIAQAKEKIMRYYDMLKSGTSFSDVAQKYSEDAGSAKNGGQMRWLRSGELPPDIEEKVFALRDSNDYSVPLQSDYGWHIFLLQSKRPVASFDKMKSQLEERIMSDERGKLAEQSKIAEIMKESDFVRYPENIDALAQVMDSSVYNGTWNPAPAGDLIEPVFAVHGKEYTQNDLAAYIVLTKRFRKELSLQQIVRTKCDEYINKELLAYENSLLEQKYPEFRYLMEEYHDGILLFNITDNMVWSKAVKDTTGLESYFNQHRGDYNWKERADVSVYTLKDAGKLAQVKKLAPRRESKHLTGAEFIKLICPGDSVPCLTITDGRYEKSDTAVTGQFAWKKGSVSVQDDLGVKKVVVVNSLVPPMPKTFNEIRGQVTADYQNYLDQQWIAALRTKYPVIVNQEVLQHVR